MTEPERTSRRRVTVAYAVAVVAVAVALVAVLWEGPGPAVAPRAEALPSPSPTDVLMAESLGDVPFTVAPYPYTTPTPAPEATVLDGTYMSSVGLEELGGAKHALPFPCVRCLPFARDPGVTTLILFEGAYFLHHQMSGFRSTGHYEVDDDRLILFNDPNCTTVRGTYAWKLDGTRLRLRVLDDPCAFEGERAVDLTSVAWTKIPVCRREVQNLWPGILGC